MEIFHGFLDFILIPAAIYLAAACLFSGITTLYFRIRYPGKNGARHFLHHHSRAHWVMLEGSETVRATQRTPKFSLACAVLGSIAIWHFLKSVQTAKADAFFLVVSLMTSFFQGAMTAKAQFTRRCFGHFDGEEVSEEH